MSNLTKNKLACLRYQVKELSNKLLALAYTLNAQNEFNKVYSEIQNLKSEVDMLEKQDLNMVAS